MLLRQFEKYSPFYLDSIIFKCRLNDIHLVAADVNPKMNRFPPNPWLNKQLTAPTFEYSSHRRAVTLINSTSCCSLLNRDTLPKLNWNPHNGITCNPVNPGISTLNHRQRTSERIRKTAPKASAAEHQGTEFKIFQSSPSASGNAKQILARPGFNQR